MMPVFQSRGVFWWASEGIPHGAFAPTSAVQGLLTIEDNGRPHLDLDFLFNPSQKIKEAPEGSRPETVVGILRDGGQRVAISGIEVFAANYASQGISYHKLRGWTCLIGSSSLVQSAEEALFSQIEINCTPYLQWFELGAGKVDGSPDSISMTFQKPDDIEAPFAHGDLTISFRLSMSGFGHGQSQFIADRQVFLTYNAKTPEGWKVVQDRVASLQEFLLMQTDALLDLGWPKVTLSGDESTYTFYYPSDRYAEESYSERNRFVEFSQIKERIGGSLEKFREKRKSAKSGYFMYTGLRRNPKATIEHRFVTLVWGLEALHRRRFPDQVKSIRLVDKIKRIIDCVTLKKDQIWLAKQLSYSAEPTLSSRLDDLIRQLPLKLDEEKFEIFCKRCARVRNDISHFGMLSDYEDYHESLSEISELTIVLTFCYHLIILLDSGTESSYLQSNMRYYMTIRSDHLLQKYGLQFL